ncbi:serum paraoxonase/arylesterase 2 [Blastomyces gilchristii SLH14081]|uniref:Serum paraoxonase/arylesterase 2 n=1 Tax=Blastomyces gilchristii (strain SLH14081) TaxID=559298 RepID=A0A179U9V5_BLAGS|nr:serum paraoxonase/arylesterase 2 [Blastomyces gilchristii SLH14081]OAT03947.1 serum paraoxonase/arylesterase 2 [Blastomyces gilchristii SLH14081]
MALSTIGKTAAALTIFIGTLSTVFYRPLVTKIDTVHNLPRAWHPFEGGSADIRFADTIKYSEDIVIDHDHGLAIISFDPSRSEWNTVMGIFKNPDPRGSLYVYDYAAAGTIKELELTGFPDNIDFHPLGINFFRSSPKSKTRLFVANHQRTGSTVAVFDVDYDLSQAKYVTTISDNDQAILSPNSIAPVSYTQFYVTNDHRYMARTRPFWNKIETSFSMPWSWVAFVDFSSPEDLKCVIVASNIAFTNGIIVTPTGKEVIVASSGSDAVYVYERDPQSNLLSSSRETIPLSFHPDNVNFDHSLDISDPTVFDTEGRFLRGVTVGGHPSLIKLMRMINSPEKLNAPSWVAEVRRGTGLDPAPCPAAPPQPKFYARTLYQSNGEHFPSSTTGAMDSKRGHLLISALYGKGVLDISWKV